MAIDYANDPVGKARRNQQSMLKRSSYFPASNLRQFEGTELSPPGAGTYYNASRYTGLHDAGLQRRAQTNLANAWQQDLAFNVQANPRMASGLEAERIGSQYRGGGSYANRPGYQTIYGPSGSSNVVTDSVAKRMLGISGGGYSTSAPQSPQLAQFNQNAAYAQGYGEPSGTIQPSVSGSVLSQGGVSNPIENTPGQPSFLQSFFPGVSQLQGFAKAAQNVYNRINPTQPNQGNSALSVVQGMQQGQTAGQALQAYSAPPQMGPRRYFDY